MTNIIEIFPIYTGLTAVASLSRSTRSELFCKKGVLRNFAKFTGKDLCQSLISAFIESLLRKLKCASIPGYAYI